VNNDFFSGTSRLNRSFSPHSVAVAEHPFSLHISVTGEGFLYMHFVSVNSITVVYVIAKLFRQMRRADRLQQKRFARVS